MKIDRQLCTHRIALFGVSLSTRGCQPAYQPVCPDSSVKHCDVQLMPRRGSDRGAHIDTGWQHICICIHSLVYSFNYIFSCLFMYLFIYLINQLFK